MIQALTNKAIDASAAQKTGKAAPSLEGALVDAQGAIIESMDFENALKESMATATEEVIVEPVQVSAEQLAQVHPSLINNLPSTGLPETTSPKVFDPKLTQGVTEAVTPTETLLGDEQVVKLAQELAPAKTTEVPATEAEIKSQFASQLKVPQEPQAVGRAPAIDFGKAEVDPQLMNLEDFVVQKNTVTKKAAPANAYGMKPQMQVQKMALENGLKQTQVVKDIMGAEGQGTSSSNNGSVNSQQFILNMMNEQNTAPKVNEVHSPSKVFDMSQIKTSNPDQIMNQISDYIVQAKAAKEPTVSMRVNHEELGMIDITVQKTLMNQETVSINIGTHSVDGKNFFQQNSKELFSHLNQVGINVADFKVDTASTSSKSEFDFNQQSNRGQGSEKHFTSEQQQRRQDSDRRQELWKLLNQDAA